MKLTVAIVALTVLTASFAAHRSHPARSVAPVHSATSFEALAQHVSVEVGEGSTTVTIRSPRDLSEIDW